MLRTLKELFQLLTPEQRRRFYLLQVLVVLMAFGELLGIASIGPFMALVADIQLLETNPVLKGIYSATGLENPEDFLFLTGLGVLCMLAFASALFVFTTWRLTLFSMHIGMEIADRLYQHYLSRDWMFHVASSTAQLTKQITTESNRVTNSIIMPVMQLISRVVLTGFIAVAVISYDPLIALVGLLVFGGGYVLVYFVIKARLVRNGRIISVSSTERFRLMNEGFGGIKDLLLLGRTRRYINQFNETGRRVARASGTTKAISLVPRYVMELIAFGAMIALVLILLKMHDGVLSQVLPVLAVYAMAGFKLLPALQQIYSSVATIKGGLPAFESIKPDLVASQHSIIKKASNMSAKVPGQERALLAPGDIALEQVTFSYPGKPKPAVDNLSLTIPLNSTVGLVGESGSGKSTAIDLILGLLGKL